MTEYEQLSAAIESRIASDPQIRTLRKKIAQGTATLAESSKYSQLCAQIMGQKLSGQVLGLSDREGVCTQLLRDRYSDVNQVCEQVMRSMDERAGIAMNPRHAAFPAERVQQLAHSLTDPTVPDETIQRRANTGAANVAISFHDDFVDGNAAFRSDAGYECYITRVVGGASCSWCSAMAGRFRYDWEEMPEDIFRRHDNCTCTVTFEQGAFRQDVWSKRSWEAPKAGAGAPPPKVFSQEEADRLEQERLSEYRGLTSGGEGGIIEENKELYPDELAGVKRGSPMTFEEADSGNVNPNYGQKGYDTNCQTCTIVNEARRRGFDVEALPNMPNSMAEKISHQYTMAWIDPETGKKPEFIVDKSKDTPKKYLEFMHSTIQPNERYIIGFTWKGKGNSGHIVNLDINENGELRIKDNQRGAKERSEWIGDKAVLNYLKRMKWSETLSGYKMPKVPKMLRIDNLQFEPDVAKRIMKGREG